MRIENIWWGQLGSSLRFLSTITSRLRECRTTVLQLPERFPWRESFYEAVDNRRASFGSQRRLRRLTWQEGQDPGRFVINELCTGRVQADYWPGKTYAEYLGSRSDIELCDYYVWIRGIRQSADLVHWTDFVRAYTKAAKANRLEQHAVFVLEYDGSPVPGQDTLTYNLEDYDCHVFCLEAAADLKNTDLPEYQAGLALSLGGNDPELCAALLSAGTSLLENPVSCATQVLAASRTSEGLPFASRSELWLESAAWKAQLILLFPILERFRLQFITKYEGDLRHHLPITNSNGGEVNDPFDLELGSMVYLNSVFGLHCTYQDSGELNLCHNVRNNLAHNHIVTLDRLRRVLALKTHE